MSFDTDMAKLIQKYFQEEKGESLTIEEILSRPRWKRVWYWWIAREKYEGKPRPNMTMEDCERIYGD